LRCISLGKIDSCKGGWADFPPRFVAIIVAVISMSINAHSLF
jgi:hypothetical protein